MDKKELNLMFENLLHIGNKTNYWNPKMKDYIYGSVNGIHVFNLIKTAKEFDKTKEILKKGISEGKKILFVATKLQARSAFSKLAIETGNYYVTEKWVPGLLTNFKTIKKRIRVYLKLLKDAESGAFDVLTKKEKAAKMLELEKLDKAFKGLKDMKQIPDMIFVVDGAFEAQSVREANSLNLPCFAVLNTNGNPDKVTNFIPANTNSVKSLEFISNELLKSLSGIKVVKKSVPKKLTDRKKTINKKNKKGNTNNVKGESSKKIAKKDDKLLDKKTIDKNKKEQTTNK